MKPRSQGVLTAFENLGVVVHALLGLWSFLANGLLHAAGRPTIPITMPTCIALFRGINVGGKNILPMKELVSDLESLKLKNVRTYIQSGNVVFQSARKPSGTLGDRIAAAIESRRDFRPHVMLLAVDELERAIAANPFPDAEAEPKSLHLFFLSSRPTDPDVASLRKAKADSERFQLTDGVFYLHAPDGIGRSKLAANAERYLCVPATARNWRTVQKLWEMATSE